MQLTNSTVLYTNNSSKTQFILNQKYNENMHLCHSVTPASLRLIHPLWQLEPAPMRRKQHDVRKATRTRRREQGDLSKAMETRERSHGQGYQSNGTQASQCGDGNANKASNCEQRSKNRKPARSKNRNRGRSKIEMQGTRSRNQNAGEAGKSKRGGLEKWKCQGVGKILIRTIL